MYPTHRPHCPHAACDRRRPQPPPRTHSCLGERLAACLLRMLACALLMFSAPPVSWSQQAESAAGACTASLASRFPSHGQACALDGSASDDPGVLALPGAPETVGNPVDLVSGHKLLRRLHLHGGLAVPDRFGQGLALVWTLYYNSAEQTDRGFGPGWRHGFDLRLRPRLNSRSPAVEGLEVEISQADGSRLLYRYDKARGVFAAQHAEAGEIHSFEAGSARRWQWRQPGGRTAHFDALGRLLAWDSVLGQRLELHYDEMGDLTRVERRVGSEANQRQAQSVLAVHREPGTRQILFASLAAEGQQVAACRYSYRMGLASSAPLREVSCSAEASRDPAQGRPKVPQGASQAPPTRPATLHESYMHEDARFPGAITGVQRHAQLPWEHGIARRATATSRADHPAFGGLQAGSGARAPLMEPGQRVSEQAHSRMPERSYYRYDASGRVVYSQGLGESSDQALRVAYAGRERRLSRGTEQAHYLLASEAQAPADSAFSLVPRRVDAIHCLWCPGLGSHRLVFDRDERGRILAVRERGTQRVVERRSYASSDRVALPEIIERPSVRPGSFARTRFSRDASGLLTAIEHAGFRPLDVSPDGRVTAFDAIQRTIRLRYRGDGEGLSGALIANLHARELSPEQLSIPLVIPGLQEIAHRWHGAQRWTDDFGRTVLLREPSGGLARAWFDPLDRITGSQSSAGLQSEHKWSENSLPLSVRHEGSARTHFLWAMAPDGRPLLREAFTESSDRDTPRVAIAWTYDAQGQVSGRVHQIGSRRYRWVLERDAAGRVVKEHLPDGGALLYRYDAEGLLELRYRQGTLGGQLLYQRLNSPPESPQGAVRYRVGAQEIVWQPLPGDPSTLARLEAGSLAAWALRNTPSADRPSGLAGANPASAQAAPVGRTAPLARVHPIGQANPDARANPLARVDPLARADFVGRQKTLGRPAATASGLWPDPQDQAADRLGGWSYDAALRWLGDGQPAHKAPAQPDNRSAHALDTATGHLPVPGNDGAAPLRMHYDPLGMPALLRKGLASGQQVVMDGWRPLLFANRHGVLQGLVVWVGSLPVAWVQAGRVYHLSVDWRGAPTHAFTSEGKVVWRAHYLQPLLPTVEASGTDRRSGGRSLRRALHREAVHIPLGVAGRWMPHPQLVDEDRRLGTLLFGAFRVLDGGTGRFLQSDPLGPAGGRDPYAYVDGRPWQYVDPWGLARLTYFAILQSERAGSASTHQAAASAQRSHQGFAIGRWSFLLEAIAPSSRAPGSQAGPLSALQDNYARHQQSLLFDAQGSFRLSQQDPLLGTWFGNDTLRFDASDGRQIMGSFREHYGAALITGSAFVVEDFDDQQATRLMALLSRDRAARTQCLSPSTQWLPPVLLDERSAPLQPDASQGQGASVQRMLRCDGALSGIPEPLLQTLYADAREGARVERLQAAAQLQESPAPSSITPTCAPDGCRTRTAIEVNGRKYYASYGSTQFVMESFLRTLRKDVLHASALDPRAIAWLGLDRSLADAHGKPVPIRQWVDLGIARAWSAARAFDDVRSRFGKGLSEAEALRRWHTMTSAQQQQWMLSTGLDSRAFLDMLAFVPDGRARTEAEARNAFAAEAVLRLGQGADARGSFGEWLVGFFSDNARFGFVSRLFLRQHLRKVLAEPRLGGLLGGADNSAASSAATPSRGSTPAGASAPSARAQQVEAEIAYRVALMHNGGEGAPGALDPAVSPAPYLRQYAEEFMRRAGRGNWEALRCLDQLQVAGLQMQTLRLS